MATFDFYIDRKITVWERSSFSVDAETEEEAKKIALELLKPISPDVSESEDSRITFYEAEIQYDTQENMLPEENAGNATLELYVDSVYPENLIGDNSTII